MPQRLSMADAVSPPFTPDRSPDIGAPPMTAVLDNGRVVAIVADACLALAGASEAIRHWGGRLGRGKREWAETIGEYCDCVSIFTYAGRATRCGMPSELHGHNLCIRVRPAPRPVGPSLASRRTAHGVSPRRPQPRATCQLAGPGRSRSTGRWPRSSPNRQQQPDAFALQLCRSGGPRRRSIPRSEQGDQN